MKLKVESSTQLVELLQVEKEMNFKFELRQHRLILSFWRFTVFRLSLSLSLAAMFSTLPLCIQAASAPFKRSQLGLFHGKCIQFGNNVPFSKHKTRRTWHPNVQSKDLRSEVLGRNMNVKVTTRALKTIKKVCLMLIDWQLPCISWMLTASTSFLFP